MKVEYLIEELLLKELISKKLKENDQEIVTIGIGDVGDYHYEYKIFITTANDETFEYYLNEELEYE